MDKSLYPVEAWGDIQFGKLMKIVNNYGGLLSNVVPWEKVGDRVRNVGREHVVSREEMFVLGDKVKGLESDMGDIRSEIAMSFQGIISMLNDMASRIENAKRPPTSPT